MADFTLSARTTLQVDDVMVRAVQFFTNERWRAQSQAPRVTTFIGRPRIPWFLLFLTVLGFLACLVPGIILYIMVLRKAMALQNIVVTASPSTADLEVVVTFPAHARKLVDRFLAALPRKTEATTLPTTTPIMALPSTEVRVLPTARASASEVSGAVRPEISDGQPQSHSNQTFHTCVYCSAPLVEKSNFCDECGKQVVCLNCGDLQCSRAPSLFAAP